MNRPDSEATRIRNLFGASELTASQAFTLQTIYRHYKTRCVNVHVAPDPPAIWYEKKMGGGPDSRARRIKYAERTRHIAATLDPASFTRRQIARATQK